MKAKQIVDMFRVNNRLVYKCAVWISVEYTVDGIHSNITIVNPD